MDHGRGGENCPNTHLGLTVPGGGGMRSPSVAICWQWQRPLYRGRRKTVCLNTTPLWSPALRVEPASPHFIATSSLSLRIPRGASQPSPPTTPFSSSETMPTTPPET